MNLNLESHEISKDELPTGVKKAFISARAAIDKKGENLRILDLSEISGFTDYFVIVTAMSDRQVQAISDSIAFNLEKLGYKPVSVEGYGEGRWVLMDYGDVIIHVFIDALRDYYDLESLWAEAPRVKIPPEVYGNAGSREN